MSCIAAGVTYSYPNTLAFTKSCSGSRAAVTCYLVLTPLQLHVSTYGFGNKLLAIRITISEGKKIAVILQVEL